MTFHSNLFVYIFPVCVPGAERRIISGRYMGLMTFIVDHGFYRLEGNCPSAISACVRTRLGRCNIYNGQRSLSPLSLVSSSSDSCRSIRARRRTEHHLVHQAHCRMDNVHQALHRMDNVHRAHHRMDNVHRAHRRMDSVHRAHCHTRLAPRAHSRHSRHSRTAGLLVLSRRLRHFNRHQILLPEVRSSLAQ
jgi:hypothetical protein